MRFLLLLWCAICCLGATYYVAPNGTAGGAGTIEDPLSLIKAISQTSPAGPGDSIYLRGSSIGYTGAVSCYLTGTVANPITVSSYPGETALIVGTNISAHVFTVVDGSSNVWIRNLHVVNANTNRLLERGAGFYVLGDGTKIMHCVINDTGTGIGAWTESLNTELVGNIIYCNGYQDVSPDRGHGHGIYMQNFDGRKLVRNNIIFSQFAKGIQAYAAQGYLRHFTLSNNISFNNGGSARESESEDNYLFGGNQSVIDLEFIDNVGHCWSTGGAVYRFGYANSGPTNLNDSLVAANNYFSGGGSVWIAWWTNAVFTNNIWKNSQGEISYRDDGLVVGTIDINHNTYYSGGSWVVNETNIYSFAQWKTATGFDADSTKLNQVDAPTPVVRVFRDPYFSNRAQISVINYGSNDVVAVNLGTVLSVGQNYEVKNAQDYYGNSVLAGTYAGGTVDFPMTNLVSAQPFGVTNIVPQNWPMMNAFVLLGSDSTRAININTLRAQNLILR